MDKMSNEEIYREFKRTAFLEMEDVLGQDMIEYYRALEILGELLGVQDE